MLKLGQANIEQCSTLGLEHSGRRLKRGIHFGIGDHIVLMKASNKANPQAADSPLEVASIRCSNVVSAPSAKTHKRIKQEGNILDSTRHGADVIEGERDREDAVSRDKIVSRGETDNPTITCRIAD
jgi:hypothetical protein